MIVKLLELIKEELAKYAESGGGGVGKKPYLPVTSYSETIYDRITITHTNLYKFIKGGTAVYMTNNTRFIDYIVEVIDNPQNYNTYLLTFSGDVFNRGLLVIDVTDGTMYGCASTGSYRNAELNVKLPSSTQGHTLRIIGYVNNF